MIKNQFGRRNLIPYIRAELALKLEGLFKAKAKENISIGVTAKNIERTKIPSCQNSDNLGLESKLEDEHTNKIIEPFNINNQINEEPEEDDFEILQPKQNIYEHAGKVLELEKPSYKRLPEIKPVDTKKELAKIAGISHDTIERVKKIQASAPAEVKQKVSTGEISINQAYTMIKREEKAEKE